MLAPAGHDSDGDPLEFTWDFGDRQRVTAATLPQSHVWAESGEYILTIHADDGRGGTASASRGPVIHNVAPTVSFIPDSVLIVGGTYTGHGAFTDPGADEWIGTVDHGAGEGPIPLMLDGKAFTSSHIYTVPGAYAITVQITDDDGGVGSSTAHVTVETPAEAVARVSDRVATLTADGAIPAGNAGAVQATLRAAASQSGAGNSRAAGNQFNAFIHQLEALARTGRIEADISAELIDAARRIIEGLNA